MAHITSHQSSQSAQGPMPSTAPLLLALAGPTSSGKTTLAHLLSLILPSNSSKPTPAPIIHLDDFYRPDSQIPLHPTGVQDWDCAGAIDWDALWDVLGRVKGGEGVDTVMGGRMRQGEWSGEKEEGDGVHAPSTKAGGGVGAEMVEKWRSEVASWWPSGTKIVIIEGFLLLGTSIRPQALKTFDINILLRARYSVAKARRENREGYVTLEGFWKDPEGYFDDVVWRNFEREYAGLFRGNDVEGDVGEGGEAGIVVAPVEVEGGVEGLVAWCLGVLRGEVGREGG